MSSFRDLQRKAASRKRSGVMWRTRSGESIPIEDLTDSHLDNTIALLDRRSLMFDLEMAACLSSLQGEMAIDAALEAECCDHGLVKALRKERKARAEMKKLRSTGIRARGLSQ